KNKTCLDVGCGSGLFSYCMYILGAKEIISFDFDPFSVECTKFLRSKVKKPQNWRVFQGSILDNKFISKLGKFDIVYAWGVLHHTGKMWEAIRNTISLLNDEGLLFIAIYNKTKFSNICLKIKEFYNRAPKLGKIIIYYSHFFILDFVIPLLHFKNPLKIINEYKKKRGMDKFIDIKDWLGGYPYEFATSEEIFNFIENLNQNCKLVKFVKTSTTGYDYLFQKNMTQSKNDTKSTINQEF
ncbi:MAG: class I SAM-dependent methyltransferase, partial [Candidatus Hodarchaeota archaeon]